MKIILTLQLTQSNQWVGVDYAARILLLNSPPMTGSVEKNKMVVMMNDNDDLSCKLLCNYRVRYRQFTLSHICIILCIYIYNMIHICDKVNCLYLTR